MRKLLYAPMQSINSTTFTGTYQALGVPLPHPASIVKVVNNSTSLITISTDGTTDHDVAPGVTYFLYDITAAHTREYVFVPKGTQYYVSGAAGTGSVYLISLYVLRE